MSGRYSVEKKYFEWMYEIVCGEYNKTGPYSFRKLMLYLHSVEFTFTNRRDINRAKDGEKLRYRFAYDTGCACADSYLEGPCSILEMMVALAIKCEENYMDNPKFGNRTRQWFWRMVASLGLNGMTDAQYNQDEIDEIIKRFLKRNYEPDGCGGLFTVKNHDRDMRKIEIWDQMQAYLVNIMHY